jgi:two-component system phosphate regulon response regulator OmpR
VQQTVSPAVGDRTLLQAGVAPAARRDYDAPMDTRLKTRVLVVDDDPRLRELLSRYLGEQGFEVVGAADAPAMDRALARTGADLLVLDLMLPGEDGLSICRRLRVTSPALPIVMLTARGDEVDRIVGLELGADDYLPKPFNPRELVARIHAVLRRRAPVPPPGAPDAATGIVRFGPYTLDAATRSLSRDGAPVAMSTGEFSLLRVLVSHPRTPMSRDRLMELSRGRGLEPFDRSIDVQISRLRKLVEDDPAHPRFIQTVWGFGYVFVPDAKAG